MTNGKTVSLKTVIWKVLNLPLASELTLEQAAEYAIEFIELVGAPLVFIDNVPINIPINSYKGKLPTNLTDIRGVRFLCGNCDTNNSVAMRYATDIYHMGYQKSGSNNTYNNKEYTYSVQNGIIFTSEEKGTVEMAYKSIAIDEDGYPLIPDNRKFKLGLEFYILKRYLFPIWSMGKITDKVYSKIEQESDWYLASANTSLQMPSVDKMESIMNGINRLIINNTAFDNFYKKFGKKEKIKKYN